MDHGAALGFAASSGMPTGPSSEEGREVYVDPSLDYGKYPNNCMKIWIGVTGELIKEVVVEGRMMRVSRRKLRSMLGKGGDVKVSSSVLRW